MSEGRRRRVVVAPDSFGEVLSSVDAAAAISAGWLAVSPTDEVDVVPVSDGGPGFVAVVHAALGGRLIAPTVTGPMGRPVEAQLLLSEGTAWIESAQACGLHLVPEAQRKVGRATTVGVGELMLAAIDAGHVRRLVVGLGGSATNDGGAGVWAALGAEPAERLRGGGAALRGLGAVSLPALPHLDIVAATDVDNQLLGPNGASAVFGPQKGADRATVLDLDDALRDWAAAVEAAAGAAGLREAAGSGAAGGLGFGLLALGARRQSGAELVFEAVGLDARIAAADLVVSGEGRLDGPSVRGKVVGSVARAAAASAVPCLVIAGDVVVGDRELGAWGIDASYSVTQWAGSTMAAVASGAEGVEAVARLAARDWTP
jgi:glycerate kinase